MTTHPQRASSRPTGLAMRYGVPGAVLAAAVALTSCYATRDAALPLVRVEAEMDLDCPQRKLKIRREIGGRYRVNGCGRSAIYHSACEHLRCTVGKAGETPTPWRDRPEPGSLEEGRDP